MLDVVFATQKKVIFEGKARSVVVPGEQGVFEILSFHKPLLSRLVSGKVVIDEQAFTICRGIIGINHNKVMIVAE